MKGYKAFANKLWNAARFVYMNTRELEDYKANIKMENLSLPDRWILSTLQKVKREINEALNDYKIFKAADTIYHFVWHQYCDWYIEASKKEIRENNKDTLIILINTLKEIIQLLFPFMPFISEELWERFKFGEGSIALSNYPEPIPEFEDEKAEKEMENIIELISGVRRVRAESGINPSAYINLQILPSDEKIKTLIEENIEIIKLLTRTKEYTILDKHPSGKFLKGVSAKWEFFIPVEGLIDIEKEIKRLEKEKQNVSNELNSIEARLKNKQFLEKAPENIVNRTMVRKEELIEKLNKLETTLNTFKNI